MHVLIIGENRINTQVTGFFNKKGFGVFSIPDVYRLRSVTGEVGNFKTVTKKDAGVENTGFASDFIVLTEQPAAETVAIDGLQTFSLYACGNNTVLPVSDALKPLVFLLDYVCESPPAATIYALKDAALLARNKRCVYYLARFIRTAGYGVESLYREAREAGVTFIKYENVHVTADISGEEFTIFASDSGFEQEIKTKTLFTDGGPDTGDRFSYAVKKLDLTPGKHGSPTGGMYFLTPALTSRRGVYHITRDIAAEGLDECLDFICTHAMSGVYDPPPFGSAVIDGGKCAFCCNCCRACPHAALEPDPGAAQMQCLPAACAGCGICASLCPAGAVTLESETSSCDNDEIGSLLVIYCGNSGGAVLEGTDGVDTLTVPCGGLIDIERLSEKLHKYDRVMSVVCPDDACRHFDGNRRACAQVKRLREMMEKAGLSADRLRIIPGSTGMPRILIEELNEFAKEELS